MNKNVFAIGIIILILSLLALPDKKPITLKSGNLNLHAQLYQKNSDIAFVLIPSPKITIEHPFYQTLEKELAKQDSSVLIFDVRGYGKSETPQDISLESLNWSHDIKAAIDYLDQDVILIGHSFSTTLVTNYALQDERVKAIVALSPAFDGYFRQRYTEDLNESLRRAEEQSHSLNAHFDVDYDFIYYWSLFTMDELIREKYQHPVFIANGALELERQGPLTEDFNKDYPSTIVTIEHVGHFYGLEEVYPGRFSFTLGKTHYDLKKKGIARTDLFPVHILANEITQFADTIK